jgi:hypothetical protein
VPELTPEDQLEVEADRRRRVATAFRLGSAVTAGTSGPTWFGPVAAGLAISLVIALVIGVVTLVHH